MRSWKSYLSKGDRVVLINLILIVVILYYLSIFWVSKCAIMMINFIRKNFVWKSNVDAYVLLLVKWKVLIMLWVFFCGKSGGRGIWEVLMSFQGENISSLGPGETTNWTFRGIKQTIGLTLVRVFAKVWYLFRSMFLEKSIMKLRLNSGKMDGLIMSLL